MDTTGQGLSGSGCNGKMKRSFFQATVVSILLYGCTTWTLTKQLEKKLDGNYTRMLRVIWNKSWRQHSTKHQLHSHLPSITKTIQVRRTRHAGHCWRNRDELISDVLLWTPTYDRADAGRPARTYIQQCENTGCSPEDLPEAMNDREKWRERVKDICASGTTWWWWFGWLDWWHTNLCWVILYQSHFNNCDLQLYTVKQYIFTIILNISLSQTYIFDRLMACSQVPPLRDRVGLSVQVTKVV